MPSSREIELVEFWFACAQKGPGVDQLCFGGNVKQVKEKQGKDGKEKQGKDGKEKQKEKQGKDKDKQGKDGKDTDGKKDHNHFKLKPDAESVGGGVLGHASGDDYEISEERHVYLVTYKDREQPADEELGSDLLDQHLQYLAELREAGILDSAAAFESGAGGIKVLIARNYDEAYRIANEDPLVTSGYYSGFEIEVLLQP